MATGNHVLPVTGSGFMDELFMSELRSILYNCRDSRPSKLNNFASFNPQLNQYAIVLSYCAYRLTATRATAYADLIEEELLAKNLLGERIERSSIKTTRTSSSGYRPFNFYFNEIIFVCEKG